MPRKLLLSGTRVSERIGHPAREKVPSRKANLPLALHGGLRPREQNRRWIRVQQPHTASLLGEVTPENMAHHCSSTL
jgi:hypothetical protein